MRLPRRVVSASLSFAAMSTLALTNAGCDAGLKGAEAEVKPHNIKLDLPAVPGFELPPPASDGSHSVKEMRVRGKKFFDSDVTIKGFVTWVYDCATAIRTPEMSDKDVQKLIEEDPTKCRRPLFKIGDSADTPGDQTVMVVEVPRELRAYESKGRTKAELAALPPVPPYKVGDEIVVTGTWTQSSPHGEKETGGLLVYKTLNNVTQNWQGPAASEAAPMPEPTKAPPGGQ
jgi:hypothetical protein